MCAVRLLKNDVEVRVMKENVEVCEVNMVVVNKDGMPGKADKHADRVASRIREELRLMRERIEELTFLLGQLQP
jgi:hypothetical protein